MYVVNMQAVMSEINCIELSSNRALTHSKRGWTPPYLLDMCVRQHYWHHFTFCGVPLAQPHVQSSVSSQLALFFLTARSDISQMVVAPVPADLIQDLPSFFEGVVFPPRFCTGS